MNLNSKTWTTSGISLELGWIFGLRTWGRVVLVGMLVSVFPAKGFAETIVAPDFLWNRGIAEKTDPVAIADTHLKIPYREDGALDHRGQFTTFTRPDVIFHDPGLNCSGLVLSICRFLFNKNWSLEEATRDRQQNSGVQSPLGKDWDFGWDLILNLTEGHNPRVLMPDGGDYPVEKYNAEILRGFPLHDVAAWQAVMSRMRPGRVYLGSISKPANRPGYRLLHYHVVLIIPDTKGAIWLYHATQRSHAHRINIGSREGMRRFLAQFTGRRGEEKHILLVEATIPDFGDQQGATQASVTTPPVSGVEGPAAAEPRDRAAAEGAGPADVPSSSVAEIPVGTGSSGQNPAANPPPQGGPELVINHLAGKVFKPVREVITHIPAFSDASRTGLRFWFQNASPHPKGVRIALKTPSGTCQYEGKIPGDAVNFIVQYPQDFGQQGGGAGQNRQVPE